MKVTETVIKMMFELSTIESELSSEYLDGEGVVLRNNLLKLFNETSNPASHELIIGIMNEAGYPWFGSLASASNKVLHNVSDTQLIEVSAVDIKGEDLLDDDTFMNLIPINGYIH